MRALVVRNYGFSLTVVSINMPNCNWLLTARIEQHGGSAITIISSSWRGWSDIIISFSWRGGNDIKL